MIRRNKGQSIVIGFMLMLALSVALFGWFQITQLPEINRNAEIEYESQVKSDMTDMRSAIWEITSDPDKEAMPVQIRTTVSYPLQSTKKDASTAQISFDTISTDAYNFENTQPNNVVSDVTTVRIDHQPALFVREPTTRTIENNVVVRNKQSSTVQSVGSQLLISGNKIYLSQVNSDSDSLVLDNPEVVLREASRDSKVITASNSSKPITLNAETTLSESFWTEQFQDVENVDETNVSVISGNLEIPLDSSESYTVLVSRINLDIP